MSKTLNQLGGTVGPGSECHLNCLPGILSKIKWIGFRQNSILLLMYIKISKIKMIKISVQL